MSLGKAVGEFSLRPTSVTSSAGEGGRVIQAVNVEGMATGYGSVFGTLTFHPAAPGVQEGRVEWAGSGYLENGEMVGGVGGGVFEKIGKHLWRVRLMMRINDGTVLLSEGDIELDERVYTGSIYKWE